MFVKRGPSVFSHAAAQGYTQCVDRIIRAWVILVLACALSLAWQKPQKPVEPPEEDETLKAREYGFNPLQATQEIKIGLYYMKKKSYKAASRRFEEATKWDPGNAEAYFHLGEAKEKLKDAAGAKQAFAKFLELAPDGKLAPSVKKKLEGR